MSLSFWTSMTSSPLFSPLNAVDREILHRKDRKKKISMEVVLHWVSMDDTWWAHACVSYLACVFVSVENIHSQ